MALGLCTATPGGSVRCEECWRLFEAVGEPDDDGHVYTVAIVATGNMPSRGRICYTCADAFTNADGTFDLSKAYYSLARIAVLYRRRAHELQTEGHYWFPEGTSEHLRKPAGPVNQRFVDEQNQRLVDHLLDYADDFDNAVLVPMSELPRNYPYRLQG